MDFKRVSVPQTKSEKTFKLKQGIHVPILVRLVVQPPMLDPISDREWACRIVGNLVVRLGTSRGTIQGPTSD